MNVCVRVLQLHHACELTVGGIFGQRAAADQRVKAHTNL